MQLSRAGQRRLPLRRLRRAHRHFAPRWLRPISLALRGRILESTAGSDTYDFGARAYVPDLGTFTSLDSVAGSAQNPITLNRYLYADANPATLVDPDGHCSLALAAENAQASSWCSQHPNDSDPTNPTPKIKTTPTSHKTTTDGKPIAQSPGATPNCSSSWNTDTRSTGCTVSVTDANQSPNWGVWYPVNGADFNCVSHPDRCQNEPTTAQLHQSSPSRVPYEDTDGNLIYTTSEGIISDSDPYGMTEAKLACDRNDAIACQIYAKSEAAGVTFTVQGQDNVDTLIAIEYAPILLAACLFGTCAAVALAAAGGGGADVLSQVITNPGKPIDFKESALSIEFGGLTGSAGDLSKLEKAAVGVGGGLSSSWLISPDKPGDAGMSGVSGAICSAFGDRGGAVCSVIAGAVQGAAHRIFGSQSNSPTP